jgi:hypothetical protein
MPVFRLRKRSVGLDVHSVTAMPVIGEKQTYETCRASQPIAEWLDKMIALTLSRVPLSCARHSWTQTHSLLLFF